MGVGVGVRSGWGECCSSSSRGVDELALDAPRVSAELFNFSTCGAPAAGPSTVSSARLPLGVVASCWAAGRESGGLGVGGGMSRGKGRGARCSALSLHLRSMCQYSRQRNMQRKTKPRPPKEAARMIVRWRVDLWVQLSIRWQMREERMWRTYVSPLLYGG